MPGQWPDCPDSERKKVPHISVALEDMVNPCELAKEWGVSLQQLWAFEVRDGQTGKYKNDFKIARNTKNAQLAAVRLKQRGHPGARLK
jgi:hypothetical protein